MDEKAPLEPTTFPIHCASIYSQVCCCDVHVRNSQLRLRSSFYFCDLRFKVIYEMIDFITYEHLTPCTVWISRNSHYTSVRAQLSLEYIIGSFRENSCLPQSLNHSQNITDVLLSKSSEDLPCLVQWGAGPQFILLIWTKTACH